MRDVSVFIDANILLYMHDVRNPQKRGMAQDWLRRIAEQQAGRTNLQVLNEVTNVLLLKKWYADVADVWRVVDQFAYFGDSPIDMATVLLAREISDATRYQWWDCLLLAAALELRCSHFLSEDLQDGRQISGLTIVDPFTNPPEAVFGKEN